MVELFFIHFSEFSDTYEMTSREFRRCVEKMHYFVTQCEEDIPASLKFKMYSSVLSFKEVFNDLTVREYGYDSTSAITDSSLFSNPSLTSSSLVSFGTVSSTSDSI